jgi:polyferredoxin
LTDLAAHEDELPRPIPWLDAASGLTVPLERPKRRLPVLQTQGIALPAKSQAPVPSPWRAILAVFSRRNRPRPGSGLPARPVIVLLVWARRLSQALFFLLFLSLLTQTTFRGSFSAASGGAVRLPWQVEGFLLADPLVALMTLLSTHELYAGLWWSLGTVLLTIVFGRAFCGWICPFGTLHHVLSFLWPGPALKGARRIASNRTKSWQVGKYYGLLAILAAAAAGSAIGGLLDPLCVMVRGFGLGVLPVLQYLGVRGLEGVAERGGQLGQRASDGALDWLGGHVWTPEQAYFHQTWLVVAVVVAIAALNRVVPRFWCRALCPLGALLGLMSRFALFGMEKDHAKCTDCNLCVSHCQGADSPEGGVKHRQDECHMCFNCEAACPEDVIKFRFFPGRRSVQKQPDLERRKAVASLAAGAAMIPSARIANWPDKAYSAQVIRPPGAVPEREFLERCIRCAECMKVCPNNALHPAFFEAGPEGLWTPILIPRIGYCEHSCVLCGQVCPTGAIQKIEEKHKLGIGVPPVRIGTAMFDRGRCLPWAMATPCTVCEEFCPTSPKAIWVEEVEVPRRGAVSEAGQEPHPELIRVKRPHVDPALCIGCGACEKVCPVVDKPAVYVTSAGESRSLTNVILLEDTAYGPS